MTPYRERSQAGHYEDKADDDNPEPTKAQLQDAAAALGLPTSGTKADLQERLAEANA